MSEETGIKGLVEKLKARQRGSGYADLKTGQIHHTPWAWRTPDSVYCGWDGSVWVYRSLDLPPWTWADGADKNRYGARLGDVFADLVGITPQGVLPQHLVKTNREFHMVSVTWWEPARVPEDTPAALHEYQRAALQGMVSPRRSLLIGVRLRARGSGEAVNKNNLAKSIQALALQVLGEDTPELEVYSKDLADVTATLKRAGGKLPTRTEQYQLESWYNFGRGPEARMIEEWDHLLVEGFDQIQLAAVSDFHRPILTAPDATWILDALNHQSGPHVVSVRGRLMPPRQARNRARTAIRWAKDQADQEARAGDVGRREVGDVYELANIFDDHFAETRYPLLSETSVIFGRRVDKASETYVEELRNRYDIEVTPLLGRQLAALDETLPCSSKRVNPYPQELSTDMVAFSGINSFSELGDGSGILAGITAEDGVPVYIDPLGAPKANQPATMAVFGDSGSGKSFFLQNIAVQSALSGLPVVMINPKGLDSLSPMAELVGGRVVSMSRIEKQGGYFDPFRFAEPEIAADIAATFILSILVDFDETRQLKLRDGLRRGALAGARCVGEALEYVDDEQVKENLRMAGSQPQIGLGIAWEPAERFRLDSNLTLIEFDRDLSLPEPGERPKDMAQRAALAAMQHVVRVSLEMMAGKTGGVLIVDEAWTFLEQAEARAALEGLGRKGRSLNVLPILATQKVADLLKYDMESLLSRVVCLSLRDPAEAKAALELAGLNPTPGRVQFLADCGPRRGADGRTRIPLAVHRDLQNRHGVMVMGPIPRRAVEAFSTNPEERAQREAARETAKSGFSGEDGFTDVEYQARQNGPTEEVHTPEPRVEDAGPTDRWADSEEAASDAAARAFEVSREIYDDGKPAPRTADELAADTPPMPAPRTQDAPSGVPPSRGSSVRDDTGLDGGWQPVQKRRNR